MPGCFLSIGRHAYSICLDLQLLHFTCARPGNKRRKLDSRKPFLSFASQSVFIIFRPLLHKTRLKFPEQIDNLCKLCRCERKDPGWKKFKWEKNVSLRHLLIQNDALSDVWNGRKKNDRKEGMIPKSSWLPVASVWLEEQEVCKVVVLSLLSSSSLSFSFLLSYCRHCRHCNW